MIYVLLPAYNEERGIGEVLKKIREMPAKTGKKFRVVVVDDGSKDRTSEVVQGFTDDLDIQLFRFEKNQGVLEVFRKGFGFVVQESRNPEEDICINLDSDDTQDAYAMGEMIQKIEEGADIVIASRFTGFGKMTGVPFIRCVFSYGVSWLMQFVVGIPHVKDYSTFYRAYRVKTLQTGFERYGNRLLEGVGFSVITSFLIKLANHTNRLIEVPHVLHYEAKQSQSGNRIFKTIAGYFKIIFECWTTNRYRNLEISPSPMSVPSRL